MPAFSRTTDDGKFEVIKLVSIAPNLDGSSLYNPPKIRVLQEERGLVYESAALAEDQHGLMYWKLYFCLPVTDTPLDVEIQYIIPHFLCDTVESYRFSTAEVWNALSRKKFQQTVCFQLKTVQLNCTFYGERWLNRFQITPDENAVVPSVEYFFQGAKYALEYQIQTFKGITTNDIPAPTQPAGPQPMVPVFPGEVNWAWFQVLETDPDSPVDWKVLLGLRSETIRQLPIILRELAKPHEGRWRLPDGTQMSGEALLTRFFFTNNGSQFLFKQQDGSYIGELDWMTPFTVRPEYINYGGRIFFDKDTNLTHIIYNNKTYKPGDEGWEFAKLVIRSSGFVGMAGVHLVACHMNWSSWPNIAMRTYLSPDHCIRKLLHPHFWRSAMIARKSLLSLVPDGGLLHRGTGFDLPGLHGLYKYVESNFLFETLDEELARRGLENSGDVFPVAKDGVEFREILHKYVSNYVDLYYTTDRDVQADLQLVQFWNYNVAWLMKNNPVDYPLKVLTVANLKSVLAELIFRVTGWHQHIGNAIALMDDPTWVSLRLVKNETEQRLVAPLESIYIQGLVTEITTMAMPTMLDQNQGWEKIFEGDVGADGVYREFINDLHYFSGKIVTYNKERVARGLGEFVDFDPHVCCVSVSS